MGRRNIFLLKNLAGRLGSLDLAQKTSAFSLIDVQNKLNSWFQFDESIELKYLSRAEWKELKQAGLKSPENNGIPLYLSRDNILALKELYEVIKIPMLKQELKNLKSTGNLQKITEKELEIVKYIQIYINSFSYAGWGALDNTEIPESNIALNCLGASILGSFLLDELGIRHLSAISWNHAAILLVTQDNKVYWLDLTPTAQYFIRVTNADICHGNKSEKNITTNDVLYMVTHQNTDSSLKIRLTWLRESIELKKSIQGAKTGLLNNQGGALADSDQYDEAIKIYNLALNIAPHSAGVCLNLGISLSRIGKQEEAIAAYKRSIENEKNNSEAFFHMGNAYFELGNNEMAVQAYTAALEINPELTLALHNKGCVLYKLGYYLDAMKFFQTALNIDPNDPYTHINIGRTFFKLEKYDEAIKSYKQALEIKENASVYKLMADVFNKLGMHNDAEFARNRYQRNLKK
jgi:tetratricopeptide (TPR) repeat protein